MNGVIGGGRISTKYHPQYETGAARFSNKHSLLNKLIKRYKLEYLELPQTIDYIRKVDNMKCEFILDVHKRLDKYFRYLLLSSKKFNKTDLKQMTLLEFMNRCNHEETSTSIIDMFGYQSEIKEMNAYDALNTFKNDFVNIQYYALKEGLTSLCSKMIFEAETNGCKAETDSRVTSVKRQKDLFEVKTKDKSHHGKAIVFAVKGGQLKQFEILAPIHKHINAVYNAPLLRIYAKYPIRQSGVWFNCLRRTTTNSFLRQIIPIDYHSGLIMISYTDGGDVNAYKDKHGKILSDVKIKAKVQTELKSLFKINIPQPSYFKVHYWQVGAHHWKPGYDSDSISKEMLNPVENVFICGEAFSQKQAWIEGALETSELVLRKIEC